MNVLHLGSWSTQKHQSREERTHMTKTGTAISSRHRLHKCKQLHAWAELWAGAFLLFFPLIIVFPQTQRQIKMVMWMTVFIPSAGYLTAGRTATAFSLGARIPWDTIEAILQFDSGALFWSTSVDHPHWPHFVLQSVLTKFCLTDAKLECALQALCSTY